MGSEPTYTDRFATDAEWSFEALGPTKEGRARALVAELMKAWPGAALVRSVGRQYPEEARARWSYGLWALRDGTPAWSGPPDPLQMAAAAAAEPAAAAVPSAPTLPALPMRVRDAVALALEVRGFFVRKLEAPGLLDQRLLVARDAATLERPSSADCLRDSPHAASVPESGLVDAVADLGAWLLAFGWTSIVERPQYALPFREAAAAAEAAPKTAARSVDEDPIEAGTGGRFEADRGVLRVELGRIDSTDDFAQLLETLSVATVAAGAPSVVLTGYPPPVDAACAWTTVTPDPAVIEVNQAPWPDATSYLADCRRIDGAARAVGLAGYRLFFNGDIEDSGGGGHLTFGGPSPETSPFFECPRLLPRLLAYVVRHPSLSYLFARHGVGSSGQSPRADEGAPEDVTELALALELLRREPTMSPETLWASLAPFLADRFGNRHRSEINIEKLWNPWFPGRGKLGLVELRALRMAATPERATARAVLFRAVLAMLASTDTEPSLVRWGPELHDRFALPFYLERDLEEVFDDLEREGLGPAPVLREELLDGGHRMVGIADLGGVRLEVRRAVEYWPLVGDLSRQHGSSRLVDPSTQRVELRLVPEPGNGALLDEWSLEVDGFALALHGEPGPVRVLGVRWRAFAPRPGLHPLLAPHGPLSVTCRHQIPGRSLRVTLHPWLPGGGVYDGLPSDGTEAARRRAERFVVEAFEPLEPARWPPTGAATAYCLDTRWL